MIHQLFSKLSLRLSLILSAVLLLVVLFMVVITVLQTTQKNALLLKAQEQQDTGLRILTTTFLDHFDDISLEYDTDGKVDTVVWDNIPDFTDHSLIDRVGMISGETATIFVWDPDQGDFVRRSTNIIKPDGERAVGTTLGQSNPVFETMKKRETFRGDAIILGKPYLTIYEPILDRQNAVVGILYVGVERTSIDATIAASRWLGTGTGAAVIFAGALIMALVISVLLKPLTVIADRIKEVANGNLDTKVPFTERNDQIGAIAQRLDGFQADLKQARINKQKAATAQAEQEAIVGMLRTALEKLAKQDLRTRITCEEGTTLSSEYVPLQEDFNSFVSNLSALISEIGAIAGEVESVAHTIGDGSTELASRVERQAGTLAESATSLNRLAAESAQTVAKADQAESVSTNSSSLSAESRAAISAAIQSMDRIGSSSEAINSIISVIEDIAFQTNLLALNAGVEAARVGEAGKGFAVVASEVRELAKSATASAQEIKKLITSSNQEIQSGHLMIQDTGQRLEKVLDYVETLGGLVSEIAGSVRRQSTDLDEINGSVAHLDSLTQENAAMVEETNAAVQQLRNESSNLSVALGGFQTGNGKSAAKTVALFGPAGTETRLRSGT